MKKILFYFMTIPILFSSLAFLGIVTAQDDLKIESRDSWGADDSVLNFEEKYSFPKKIIVMPVKLESNTTNGSESIKELYYYFATRSGFGDLPFHFIVHEDGSKFEANSLGAEANIGLTGSTKDSIIIAYVAKQTDEFSISSIQSMKNLLTEMANSYSIDPDKIFLKGLEYTFGEQMKMENTNLVNLDNETSKQFNDLIESVKKDYSPRDIVYKAEVVSVDYPEKELEMNKTAEVKLKVKNTGKFNFYSGSENNVFMVNNNPFDERSSFYEEETWDSPSRLALLEEGSALLQGEEKEFKFSVKVPLYPPEKSEDFILVGPDGEKIEGTEFSINLKIKKSDINVIEITDTEVGYLNVRSTPGFGEVVTKVVPGERFVALEYQNGYYKINANGKEGWVISKYVKEV